ncbi:MAG: excisionase family DNA-binding protein [Alicyclobacillus sp.]|nr:excisionase family DNA-binding protein [Alicyclobacillus sp.]
MQIDELRSVLTMENVPKYLRIGRTTACELAHRPDFPAVRIGRLVRVNREAFLRWCGHPEYRQGPQELDCK